MDHDWLFLKLDGSQITATLNEGVPACAGDGKWHDGVGYAVRYILKGRISSPNPFAIATEQPNANGT